MYYTITNAIGTEIEANDGITLICGDIYENKIKATKDADYILAFSKVESGWRFDGQAILDYGLFCKTHIHNIEGLNADDFDKTIEMLSELLLLAWKSEKINIQSRIRPSKDSKKQIAKENANIELEELKTQMIAGDITVEDYADKCRAIVCNV